MRMALFQDSKQPKSSPGCTQQHKHKMHLDYQPWKNAGFICPRKERSCGQNMIEFWNRINHQLHPFKSLRSTTEKQKQDAHALLPECKAPIGAGILIITQETNMEKHLKINMSSSNVERQVWIMIFLQPNFEFTRNAAATPGWGWPQHCEDFTSLPLLLYLLGNPYHQCFEMVCQSAVIIFWTSKADWITGSL